MHCTSARRSEARTPGSDDHQHIADIHLSITGDIEVAAADATPFSNDTKQIIDVDLTVAITVTIAIWSAADVLGTTR